MSPTLLIAGIGNPEIKYNQTWHNAGFNFVDFLKEALTKGNKNTSVGKQVKDEPLDSINTGHRQVLMYKSTHFMNDSGIGIAKLLGFLKIPHSSLILCYDDLDIELGKTKLQFGRHPKAHNGVLSVISALGSEQFYHLRLGIYTPESEVFNSGRDYVLSAIPETKKEALHEGFLQAQLKLKQEFSLDF
jgi:PTH1 family peptidyl-tRNA hydrolase